MKALVITFFFMSAAIGMFAQTSATFSTTGNWETAANWSGSNIGNTILETVTLNASPTVNSPSNYTTGAITMSNNVTLTVKSGATLTLGASGNAKSLTTNNNAQLTVAGTLVIWGDLVVNNNIVMTITGTLIVHGNVVLNNNANISVTNGKLQVGGNFTGDNNNNVTTSGTGTVDVSGNVNIGNGSNLNGPAGSFHVGGTCTGPASFCQKSALPISLVSFTQSIADDAIVLKWTTVSELNFDYFDIEKSEDGITFYSIANVKGHGTTREINNYQLEDSNPTIGKNYYRLVSVDFDGYTEMFPVAAVNFQGSRDFSVSPNPTDGESITGLLNFSSVENAQVVVFNAIGNIVGSFEMKGKKTDLIFTTPLKSGIYYAKYTSEGFSKVVRFIVN